MESTKDFTSTQTPQVEDYTMMMKSLGEYGRMVEVKKNIWSIKARVLLGAMGIFALVVLGLGLTVMFIKLVVMAVTS